MLFNIVENYLKTIQDLKQNSNKHLRPNIVAQVLINTVIRKIAEDPFVNKNITYGSGKRLTFKMAASIIMQTNKLHKKVISRKVKGEIKKTDKYKTIIHQYEEVSMQLAPKVEGRIIKL